VAVGMVEVEVEVAQVSMVEVAMAMAAVCYRLARAKVMTFPEAEAALVHAERPVAARKASEEGWKVAETVLPEAEVLVVAEMSALDLEVLVEALARSAVEDLTEEVRAVVARVGGVSEMAATLQAVLAAERGAEEAETARWQAVPAAERGARKRRRQGGRWCRRRRAGQRKRSW